MNSPAVAVPTRPARLPPGGSLLLLNAALVGWLWLAPGRSTPPQPELPAPAGATFLADTLHLSAVQRVHYDLLQAR